MPERSAHEPVGGPVAGTPGDRVPLSNPAIDPEGLAWTRVSPKHLSVVVLSTLLSTLFWLAALGWPAVLAATGVWSGVPLGLLLLPPYLTECDQLGLLAHASAVCAATDLGVIVYNRANAIYSAATVARLAEKHPNFIGFKDGVGDIEHLTKVVATNGDRLFYLGGLPTAETFALPLLQLGMSTYSSAMYNFVPEFALEFYADVRAQDRAAVTDKLNRFVLPYIEIRDRVKGYGVSIVKGGLKAVGRDAGGVRPPLQDLTETDLADLTALIDALPTGTPADTLQRA